MRLGYTPMNEFERVFVNLSAGDFALNALAIVLLLVTLMAVRIVPQSEQHVVERLGRLCSVLGPGPNLIVPFLDCVKRRFSILERQLAPAVQDAITADNVLLQVETSLFYRINKRVKSVYRTRDVGGAITTTIAGKVRSEIGSLELDEVQSNRAQLIHAIQGALGKLVPAPRRGVCRGLADRLDRPAADSRSPRWAKADLVLRHQ